MNIAVIGSSGAIGAEFVRQFAQSADVKKIFSFSKSGTSFSSEKVSEHFIDIEDEDSVLKASQITNQVEFLDIVVVATGVLHNEQIRPEKSISQLSASSFSKILSINVVGPAVVAKHFLPRISKNQRAVFAFLSAKVASISDNKLGGWHSYRSSKIALNMIIKNCAIEIERKNKEAIIIGLHPGTVDSKLSKPFQASVGHEVFTPAHSVESLIKVIKTVTPEHSGLMINYDGLKINP